MFIGEVISAVKIFPYMYLLRTAVNILTQNANFFKYMNSVSFILTIILLLELLGAIIGKVRSNKKTELDLTIQDEIMNKNTTMDYYTLSTKEYFILKSKAIDGYNQGCIEKNVSLLSSIISNIILLTGIIYTISSLGLLLLLPIFITILVRVISEIFDRSASYIRTTKMAEINRKSGYLHKICENIKFAKEIRIFNLQNKFDSRLENVSQEKNSIWKKYMRTFRYSSATHIISDIFLQLVIYIILVYRVLITKSIGVGDFVFFFAAYQQIQNIVGNLALSNINIFLNSNYLFDFMSFWLFKKGIINNETEQIYDMDSKVITINFENVSFRYPNTDFDALSNINLKLIQGESYLVVGKNGAGKSTLVKLICRLYKPTSGKITLNGIDIQKIDMNTYLRLLSVLFQDYKTLKLTIKDNITSMDDKFDQVLLTEALIGVDLINKINSLPNTINTSYTKSFDKNGTEFSGGEAQKMMIARTLYKNASIQIFDEPTSGLDAIADEKIYNYIQSTSKNKLIIYITHRLSTGVGCNNILVLSNGNIVEAGNHNYLMSLHGIYESLFTSQAKLYAENI
jgi:ABC-type multidrug transport system fused ATPase/permease subunit